MSTPFEEVLAVIYPLSAGSLPAGAGLFVGDNLVITCAHVVNKALGLPLLNTGRPTKSVKVKLHTPGSPDYVASIAPSVDSWSNPPATTKLGADLCLLQVATGSDKLPQAVLLDIRQGPFPMNFRAGGFPRDFGYDVAAGEILGTGPMGLLMLRPDLGTTMRLRRAGGIFGGQSRPPGLVHAGFSGGPVEVDGGIVGLITEANDRVSDETAYAIPVSAFPQRIAQKAISHTESGVRASPAQPVVIHPLPNNNWARGVEDNAEKNGRFSFTAGFNLMVSRDIFLLGFGAHYFAPDGCACLNLEPKLQIGGAEIAIGSDYFSLKQPIKLKADTAVQIHYWRDLRPPLLVQVPEDCDYGDLWLSVSYSVDGTEITEEPFFRFEPGGRLVKTEGIREPPILSDTVVASMRASNLLSDDEYAHVSLIRATSRYQAVKYDLKDDGIRPISPELRAFLIEIHARAAKLE